MNNNIQSLAETINLLLQIPQDSSQTVEGQVGLDMQGVLEGDLRSQSAPVAKPPQAEEEEDSSSDDRSDSSMSMSSAGKIARSPDGSVHEGKEFQLPTETINPLELSNPRPPSAPRPASQGRPGSERHKVLPPISPKPIEY